MSDPKTEAEIAAVIRLASLAEGVGHHLHALTGNPDHLELHRLGAHVRHTMADWLKAVREAEDDDE